MSALLRNVCCIVYVTVEGTLYAVSSTKRIASTRLVPSGSPFVLLERSWNGDADFLLLGPDGRIVVGASSLFLPVRSLR